MDSFEILLEGSAREHGHLCPGQVVGVRMAMLGCELIGLNDPRNILEEIKQLIVYVEIDRCATDAITYVTGAKLGRRSLKFIDNGIMAATFVNLGSDKAVRIASTETSRDLAAKYAPDIIDKQQQQLEGYKQMPEHEMFVIQPVEVDIPIHDMPGPTRFKAVCEQCQVVVRDKKEVFKNGRILCRTCALGGYYAVLKVES